MIGEEKRNTTKKGNLEKEAGNFIGDYFIN